MLKTFEQFLGDESAWDMYITGVAGTGKTTGLRQLIEYCHKHEIPAITTAFTHKACGILRSKLPGDAKVTTLHSFLNKRPTINQQATNVKHISSNAVFGDTEHKGILFVDEYSMVGERDNMDVIAAQDPEYGGIPNFKVVWIGDPHQLPPVGDMQTVVPTGDYQVVLKTVYRQASSNPLSNTLTTLVDMIEGAEPAPLSPHKTFIRGQDIAQSYASNGDMDKVILAWTNERVEFLNASIMDRSGPLNEDLLFSPTTKKHYTFFGYVPAAKVKCIKLAFGDEELHLHSKFKTLEHLQTMPISFANVTDEEGECHTVACTFGHYQHKLLLEKLKAAAAKSNADIERQFRGYKAAGWAAANKTHPLARARAKAWRDFLSFNDCVICLDFAHAMTVHKSQGSTYKTVYVDTDDIHKCAHHSFIDYLKLMYVAISRASHKVVTP